MDGVQEERAVQQAHDVPDERADAAAAARPRRSPRRRRTLGRDLAALGIVGVLLVAAFGATGVVLYRDLYSPTAFVTRYLSLLERGQAAEALALPGVAVDSADLTRSGLSATADGALLRRAALGSLSKVTVESESVDDGIHTVVVRYDAGPHHGRTTFRVEQAGWAGVAPTWRFATSPLAAIDLTVRGATQFSVNGFDLDSRQVAPEGADADPLDPVSLLVFSPGLYSIAVDTAISASPGVAVLSDTPQAKIPVDLQTQPTDEFVGVVQDRVESFLTECATQQVLQPTGCPFGLLVRNRIVNPPEWSISQQPTVTVSPDGAGWTIDRTQAVAHIVVDIQSLFDGEIHRLDEAVPFFLSGSITILPDGTASIGISPAD